MTKKPFEKITKEPTDYQQEYNNNNNNNNTRELYTQHNTTQNTYNRSLSLIFGGF